MPPPGNKFSSSPSSSSGSAATRGAWKYSDAIAVGIGGEWVRLMRAGFGRQPVDLKGAELRKPSFSVNSRSPTPSATSFR